VPVPTRAALFSLPSARSPPANVRPSPLSPATPLPHALSSRSSPPRPATTQPNPAGFEAEGRHDLAGEVGGGDTRLRPEAGGPGEPRGAGSGASV
jgi:hypothetical protein